MARAAGPNARCSRGTIASRERPGETLRGRILGFSPDGELEARFELREGLIEPVPRSIDAVLLQASDDSGAPVLRRHRFVRVN